MTAKHLKEFADLYAKGFRPYTGEILPEVYEQLDCRDPKRAYWVCLWPILHCFGCSRRCTPKHPQGFQLQLPSGTECPARTATQLLSYGRPLTADEVAFCLGISRRQVYNLYSDRNTVLEFLQDRPLRCTPESVRAEMRRIE
jgi:predicted DNA-binding transcriptional regulator AlpA